MDRHTPVHPLPEEIQKMSRDETVCKYCGVSYLILHEFKLMEDKVKEMEEKVKFYEGSIEREKRLQEKLQHLNQDFEQCTAANESKTERLKIITLELEKEQKAIQDLNEQLWYLQKEKKKSLRQSQLLQKTLEKHQLILRKTLALVPFIRGELNSIKEGMFGILNEWISQKGEMFLQIKSMNNSALADLTRQIETIELKFQDRTAEMSTFKELFIKKSKEVEDYQNKLQKLESAIETSESRYKFTNSLKEQEQSLLACQCVCKHLQEEVIEKERKDKELKKRTSCLESELEIIKNLLKQREEEVAMLKRDRESLLISHQSKTEQLQETLRQKVLNERNWQEKIEADRAKEQAHHKEEILRLREDTRMELDVEKQRHQESIAKYQKDQDELLHMKVPALISSATNNLRREMETLEKKLHEAQTKLTEKNSEQERERRGLNKQVTELEAYLKEEQNTHHSVTEDMREEIKKKSCELQQLIQEKGQLIENLNHAQEENALLQDTVRRECEERYDLTEALTQAREQIMELKKRSGSFPLSQCSLSQGSLTSSAVLVNNHGQKSPNGERGMRLSGGLCDNSRASKAPAGTKYKACSNSGLPALPIPRPPSRRTSSLDESRRRITAAIIGRQLSQQ